MCGALILAGAGSCKPCPELPRIADFGEGDRSPVVVRAGKPAAIGIPVPYEVARPAWWPR